MQVHLSYLVSVCMTRCKPLASRCNYLSMTRSYTITFYNGLTGDACGDSGDEKCFDPQTDLILCLIFQCNQKFPYISPHTVCMFFIQYGYFFRTQMESELSLIWGNPQISQDTTCRKWKKSDYGLGLNRAYTTVHLNNTGARWYKNDGLISVFQNN